MNKEDFIQYTESSKAIIKYEQNRILEIKEEYIQLNKFCDVGKSVKIELQSGRIVSGKVHSFNVFIDKNVYVDCYIDERNIKRYITVPYKRIKLIE